MIDRQTLLADLQGLLKRLEADLLERSESREIPDVGLALRAEYERARQAERTAQNYEDWRGDAITQAAAAWVLSCVFVRFLEDNRLIDPPKIAGVGQAENRLQRARDEHELYFRAHPRETDREYLLAVFDELARLPGGEVFSYQLSVISLPASATENRQLTTDNSRNWLSGDAAGELLRFFQKIDANTGALVHDFTDPEWDTRFLGDLYQDLSEAARKKYALLQTPEFVEEFILDRTLEPALDEFGLVISHWSLVIREENPDDQQLMTNDSFKLIDPACGSGHFLLGAFGRILDRWQRQEPGGKMRDLVQRTLDSIHGVDLNPYAVAIARFRLLLVAMRACGIRRLADAPGFRLHLACSDSLLHAPLQGGQQVFDWELTSGEAECEHAYQSENLDELKRILRAGRYHAVVANPPYITPKDRQLNERYRKRFVSCHMKYSLAVPFMEMLFRLAVSSCQLSVVSGQSGEEATEGGQLGTGKPNPAGFVGQITANSFMKREFGKKLIETFLPRIDLTHVIDTSGAYIPGHGTPTVILFGRNRAPVSGTIRAVMGIRGEPTTPEDPARGLVWTAIVGQLDQPGSQSDFVSVSDAERERFHAHPWSIGGGGAAELKERLEEAATETLSSQSESIGITSFTLEDDVFIFPENAARRHRMSPNDFRPMVVGDIVRDWGRGECEVAVFPYDADFCPISAEFAHPSIRYLWLARTCLSSNKMFGGKTKVECGLKWYEFGRLTADKLRTPLSIVFAFVATHNHFVLDRGGKVFNRSAPVIKLPADATEDDHLALLGLLNSSTACFWMKQVFHDKGSTVDSKGARQTTVAFENFREFTSTGLQQFPLPDGRPLELARRLDQLAAELRRQAPAEVLATRREGAKAETAELGALAPLRETLSAARAHYEQTRGQMIHLQEELDWACYQLYGLIEEDSRQGAKEEQHLLSLGQRAFEIVLARRMARGEVQTTWFERHGSVPITELPADWPDAYRQLVQRRIDCIRSNPAIGLIEQPEYKRRWNTEPWESQVERALRNWLLDRLESYFDFDGRMQAGLTPRREGAKQDTAAQTLSGLAPLREISLYSIARLADVARQDAAFLEVAEVYRDDPAFDVQRLVQELVQGEHVPLLPVLRYKPSGLRKRQEWERTWELQRREDELVTSHSSLVIRSKNPNDQGLMTNDQQPMTIPVPPKYTSADFISTGGARYWALRGKLDVPKERWVSFPHCEGPDGTLVIAWAGYDHLQLARAISAYFVDVQERLGGRDDPRLVPLLAAIIELLPWLRQWHHDLDPDYNQRMDEVFEGFVTEEAKNLGLTIDQIKAWQPPKKTGKKRK